MSRVELALNVPGIDAAFDFYTKLFATAPNKRKPGYANFAIADPPLKLVLFENAEAPGRLNHLGVEVTSSDEVAEHQARLTDESVPTVAESGTCCFANQDNARLVTAAVAPLGGQKGRRRCASRGETSLQPAWSPSPDWSTCCGRSTSPCRE
jgi:Glyoxalase/Bleomycin resistance protein/Dioxygenase superfamily